MKILILLFTAISSVAFAGGSHVGTFYVIDGGSRIGTLERIINGQTNISTQEIIFNFGQNQNEIRLGYGSFVNNQWQIEKIKLPTNLNQIDPAVLKALNESALTKNWATVK